MLPILLLSIALPLVAALIPSESPPSHDASTEGMDIDGSTEVTDIDASSTFGPSDLVNELQNLNFTHFNFSVIEEAILDETENNYYSEEETERERRLLGQGEHQRLLWSLCIFIYYCLFIKKIFIYFSIFIALIKLCYL